MDGYKTQTLIIRSSRLPRLFGGIVAGMGLALAGTLLQRVTDNPLAAPNLLGINAGAGFSVLLLLVFAPSLSALLPLSAFIGALLTSLLILGIARMNGMGKTAIVLTGVALSALFQAGISFLSKLDPDALVSYTDFSIGGLYGLKTSELLVPSVIVLVCFVLSLFLAKELSLFCLGDTLAISLGVNVKKVRLLALILASASAAAAVSFAGLIGFVGLIVPHVARKIVVGNARKELLLSPLLGASLLLLADLLARTAFAPTEIPVGVFTALLGVPFFLILVLKRRNHVSM